MTTHITYKAITILVLSLIFNQLLAAPIHKSTDLRILIDVSGSMKKNDPHNLRIPAIRLLSGLLPYKIKAGIWIFSGKTRPLVTLSKVTKRWKRHSLKRAVTIHSRGQHTNIESALKTVSRGWKSKSKQYDRHLIILTDGMIDISKIAKKNTQSRHRIYTTLIPLLKKAGVKVHTIALSNNADHDLLRSLSSQTNGWYRRINNTNSLHRIFLKLFEKSTHTDKVPITANRFKIDKSVQDMTVLVFRQANSKPGALLTPSGKRWTAKSHPKNVKWMHEANFDLVTAPKPEAGQWGIISKLDPDNRVMIVTNLKLNSSRLPQAIVKGDRLTLNANISRQNKIIRARRFMRLVKFYAEGKPEFSDRLYLHDDGRGSDKHANDGHYSLRVDSFKQVNRAYIITITAKSGTFERISQQSIHIYKQAFRLTLKKLKEQKTSQIVAWLQPGLFIPDSAQISIVYADGSTQKLERVLDGSYQAKAKSIYNGQKIHVKIDATRTNNSHYTTQIAQRLPVFSKPMIAHQSTPHKHRTIETLASTKHSAKVDPSPKHKQDPSKEEQDSHDHKKKKKKKRKKKKGKKHKNKSKRMIASVSWGIVIPGVVFANLLLLAAGFMWRRKKTVIEQDMNGDEADE
ncbi:hypothetical protein MNBD_GAMMA12-2244 [hydrothermal vent metagenome]|uniref:VWFA domain-containing protein n=1 Tax=hydrothermal vent metagenome TaxID=652676 RepID=A0A3B0Z982_9ZZZZ